MIKDILNEEGIDEILLELDMIPIDISDQLFVTMFSPEILSIGRRIELIDYPSRTDSKIDIDGRIAIVSSTA
jgi:hypothetical protein